MYRRHVGFAGWNFGGKRKVRGHRGCICLRLVSAGVVFSCSVYVCKVYCAGSHNGRAALCRAFSIVVGHITQRYHIVSTSPSLASSFDETCILFVVCNDDAGRAK